MILIARDKKVGSALKLKPATKVLDLQLGSVGFCPWGSRGTYCVVPLSELLFCFCIGSMKRYLNIDMMLCFVASFSLVRAMNRRGLVFSVSN